MVLTREQVGGVVDALFATSPPSPLILLPPPQRLGCSVFARPPSMRPPLVLLEGVP